MRESLFVAFDTSGSAGAVAVARGPHVLARVVLPRLGEHAAGLVPALDEALAQAGVQRYALERVVVGEGPGSFTGVRIAAATAKGLAHALRIPITAISSLAAAALAADGGAVRYALFDARRERVYGACYGVGIAGVRCLVPPHGGTLRDVLGGEVPAGAVFVGEGVRRHRAAIEGAGYALAAGDGTVTLAEGLVRYLAREPGTPSVEDPRSWEPRYVRAWGETEP